VNGSIAFQVFSEDFFDGADDWPVAEIGPFKAVG